MPLPVIEPACDDCELELVREPAEVRQLRLRADLEGSPLLPATTLGWLPFLWRRVLFPGPCEGTATWRWSSFLALALLTSVLLFPWLGFHLFEPDEGRYAQIPFEMLMHGDWIVPTLQGEPYLDKPPLFYWSVLLAYGVFGVHDWAARLVPALAVQLSVLLTYVWGRRIVGERSAFWGALALCLAPGFVGMGRLLLLDGLLTLWVTTSLLAAFLATQTPRLRFGWWLCASVACGLGVLTKGPVAVLLLVPPLIAQRWLAGAAAPLGWRGWGSLAAVVLALTLPWYAAVSFRLPEFGGYFFWKHNVLRFVQPFDHERPVWFYVPLLLVGLFPLTLLLPAAVRWLLTSDSDSAQQRCPAVGYLLLASGWCVFFFSMAGSKLPTYILPAVPAGCLALGAFIARTHWRQSRWIHGAAAATFLFLLVGHSWFTPTLAWERSPMRTPSEVQTWCNDRNTPVFCFPRHVDSMAFYAGRSDFRSYRSKDLGKLLEELDKTPRAVVLFAHRNSLETMRRCLPPHLRVTEERPMGLCSMAVVERRP